MALTKVKSSNITLTTPSASSNDTSPATTAYVTTALANLVDSAPSTLNTLNELAAALGDDANFSTTVTNSIAGKLPLAGGTMTGNLLLGDSIQISLGAGGDLVLSSDGTNGTIATSNGALILDTDSDIHLDANGGDVYLKDGGTTFGQFTKNGNDFEVRSTITNGDFKIIGERTAGTINALTFDMSDGGAATFNSHIQTNYLKLENAQIEQSQGDLTLDVAGNIVLDADGGEILLKDGGTEVGRFLLNDNNHLKLKSIQSDADILFQGNDGGSGITALRLDMSDAGTATFNHDIKVGSGGIVQADTLNNRANSANIIYRTGSTTVVGNNANALVVTDSGNVAIGATSAGAKLDVNVNSSTAYSATGESREDIIIHNTNGSDGSGVDNHSTLGFHVADGATSQGFISYVRTGDNTGTFTFSQRTGGSSYAESVRITDDINLKTGNIYLTGSNDRRIKLSDSGISGVSDSNNTVHIRADNDYMKLNAAGNGGHIFEVNGVGSYNMTSGGDLTMTQTNAAAIFGAGGGATTLYSKTSAGNSGFGIYGENNYSSCGMHLELATNSNFGWAPMYINRYLANSGEDSRMIQFDINGGSDTGAISYNFGTSGFELIQTSDYRLKSNIVDYTGGLEKINAVKVRKFTKNSTDNIVGFVAHELQEVLPVAVSGVKDEVGVIPETGETGPKYQGVQKATLIPYLVSAIQEQQEQIETLKQEVEELKGG